MPRKNSSVLSIPGLPNGFLPLSSKLYHDYEKILEVIEKKEGNVNFSEYIWPKIVKHPMYHWLTKIPGLSIWSNYALYNYDASYRGKIVRGAKSRIEKALKQSDRLYLILHSHGNRIALDALLSIDQKLFKKKEVICLCFAPAYHGVGKGLVPSGFEDKTLKKLAKKVKIINFRIRSDLLSGTPPLPTHTFWPRWWEFAYLSHSLVRRRKDVMESLRESIKPL